MAASVAGVNRKAVYRSWMPALLVAVLAAGAAAGVAGEAPPAPRKRALLVSVSDYRAPYATRKDLTAWPSLRSDLDAANLREVLVHRYGFPDDEILMLQDLKATRGGKPVPGAATRAGIVSALRSWLVEPARPGDVLVFLYSGHGQQVRDADGDEPDGLDEALVPYDFVGARAAENAPRLLRDDDLGSLLRTLSERMRGAEGPPEGSVLCVVDCCHAGTATRGSVAAKGRGWDPRQDGPVPLANPRAKEQGLLPTARGWTAFSACQSHESAFEERDESGKPLGGALTYQLCAALREAAPGSTYRDVLERVRTGVKAVRPTQTPGAEGDLDRVLFSGLAQPVAAAPVVLTARDGTAELSWGRLHGVTEGSRYGLYRSPLAGSGGRLGEAIVQQVDAYSARARVQNFASGADLRGARAVLEARSYPPQRLRVRIEAAAGISDALRRPRAAGVEEPLEFLEPGAGDADVRLSREVRSGTARLVLRRDDGTVLTELPEEPDTAETLRERLLGLWRWRYLSSLRASGPASLDVAIRVIPVDVTRQGDAVRVAGDRPLPADGRPPVLRAGDHLRVEVTNRSPAAVYATVLNLQPDGSIAPVFPHPEDAQVEENRIRGGGTLRVPGVFAVQEPFGTDLFKVIVTREKVDFSPILYRSEVLTRGERERHEAAAERAVAAMPARVGPLARLLQGASNTRAVAGSVDPDVWGTAAVSFETRRR